MRPVEHQMVKLKRNMISTGFESIPVGTIGTVVHVYPPIPEMDDAVEVEFTDPQCVEMGKDIDLEVQSDNAKESSEEGRSD